MTTETSRLTAKNQATIPAKVRKTLGLRAGEVVAFEIEGGEVRLRKATALDIEFAKALPGTLTEWNSKADDKAYREL